MKIIAFSFVALLLAAMAMLPQATTPVVRSAGTPVIGNVPQWVGSPANPSLGPGITYPFPSSSFTFLQAGSGAITRTAQDKMRDVVSVKDFGAMCDGSTDDYVHIVAAINAAVSLGRSVLFPGSVAGGCATTRTINIPAGMSGGALLGQSAYSSIKAITPFVGTKLITTDTTLTNLAINQLTFNANDIAAITTVVDLTYPVDSATRTHLNLVNIVGVPTGVGATGLIMDGNEDSSVDKTEILADLPYTGEFTALQWRVPNGNIHISHSVWYTAMNISCQNMDVTGSTIGPIMTDNGTFVGFTALAQSLVLTDVYMYARKVAGNNIHFLSRSSVQGIVNVVMNGGLLTDFPVPDGEAIVSFQGPFGGRVQLNGVAFYPNANAGSALLSAATTAVGGTSPVFDIEAPFLQGTHIGTPGAGINTTVRTQPQASYASVFFPGVITSPRTGTILPLSYPVRITRVTAVAVTSGSVAGCATAEIVGLSGSSSTNLTLANGAFQWDSGAISVPLSGAQTINVVTAAAGCSTPPADVNVMVELQPQ